MVSCSDAMPEPSSALRTSFTRSIPRIEKGERLTLTVSRARPGSWRPRRCSPASASRSTQRSTSWIIPVSSATGMKSRGEISPRVGCCQRTSASQPCTCLRLHVDDGLELDPQLRGLERMEEVGSQLHAGERRRVHLRLEEHVAVLAIRLGPIHGHVGIAQQVAGPEVRAAGEGHPDAGARHHPLPLHHERGLEGAEQAPGQPDRVGGSAGVLHQDRELVTAQPAGEVAPAQAGADPVPDLDQQLVPRGVAEAVVDHLEAIDVE